MACGFEPPSRRPRPHSASPSPATRSPSLHGHRRSLGAYDPVTVTGTATGSAPASERFFKSNLKLVQPQPGCPSQAAARPDS